MAYGFQIVIDSATPHQLADWWVDTLGWQIEPTDEDFIRRMVAEGHAGEDETIVHNGQLRWRPGVGITKPDAEDYPRILFQLVPEPKTVKNRVHLDLRIGADKVEAELERLTAKGAKFLHRGSQGPFSWVTITDPEGNELCLS